LWAVLPGLLLGYIRLSLTVRRIRPEFSLRKSESIELSRAILLYEKVCRRLKEINDQSEPLRGSWSGLLSRCADDHQHAEELDDLEAHAHHLRVSITRLKRRPFQRLRSWVHTTSTQFAFARALAAHVAGLVLLIVGFRMSEQTAWAKELIIGESSPLVWYPFDVRLFYANAVAVIIAILIGPLAYFVRRASLRRQYDLEFCEFAEFAAADPDQIIDRQQADHAGEDSSQQHASSEPNAEDNWFTVLGLSQSATIEEIKETYKALIKQNHPDRVHGMSPMFSKLAEAETKKINMAYREALIFVSTFGRGRGLRATRN
jgi:hypothetical protein